MLPMKAKITVTLKNGVLDPQGKAIENALGALGFEGVGGVRQGRYFEVALDGTDRADAEKTVETMCRKLLANTVIEDYHFEIAD